MFLHELIALLFFFLKALVILATVLGIVGGVIALASKNKIKEKLRVKPLNKHYEKLEETVNATILSKKEQKQREKTLKAKNKKDKKSSGDTAKRVFVITFMGDIKASAVQSLREEITAILEVACPADTVFVKLESFGGTVHGYGLAASELIRIKEKAIPLIISVDKVAASGGYMMACVANQLIAAPFAIIGSIGVVAEVPNFHRFLKKHDVDFEQITAGEYKRTLTYFGENTSKARQKVQEEINDAHELFKEFIKQNRPQIDLSTVATGEYWFAARAQKLNLVDQLMTSDEYLSHARKEAKLFEITYAKPKKISEKIFNKCQSFFKNIPFLSQDYHSHLR